MTVVLDGVAEYVVKGDTITASVSIFDSADQLYHPERVASGQISFMQGTTAIYQRSFDRRFGCSDGAFHFDVAHPATGFGLTLSVSVVLIDSTNLAIQIPVRIDNDDDSVVSGPPLAEQPQVGFQNYGVNKL